MDSIDTFASCFTHPFNSLVDLDEEQFRPDKHLSVDYSRNDDLSLASKVIKDKNFDKRTELSKSNRSPINKMDSLMRKASVDERTRRSNKEVPLIVDISSKHDQDDFRVR